MAKYKYNPFRFLPYLKPTQSYSTTFYYLSIGYIDSAILPFKKM